LNITGGVKLHRQSNSPAVGLGSNSGADVVRTGASELGVGLGHWTELQRGFLVAEVQQSGKGTTAQGVLRGGARRAALGLRQRLRGRG